MKGKAEWLIRVGEGGERVSSLAFLRPKTMNIDLGQTDGKGHRLNTLHILFKMLRSDPEEKQ